jgi:hypothetical protein
VKITSLWDLLPRSLAEVVRRFKDMYSLHHQGDEAVPNSKTVFFILWSVTVRQVVHNGPQAVSEGKINVANIVTDSERMNNIPIHVCAKTDFVSLTTGIMFFLFTCMHFWAWEILRRWSACAPKAYEAVRDYRKFDKHCSKTSVT